MQDSIPLFVAVLSFGAVTAIAFVVGQYVWLQARIQRRLLAPAQTSGVERARPPKALDTFIARHFDEKRFGVDDTLRGKLRRELVRAGYFRNDAINYYIFARLAVVIVLPLICYVAVEAFVGDLGWYLKLLIVSIAALLGIAGPDAFLARRQRMLTVQHRQVFPDLLDLLVVCVDAGLSLEAALDRITGEMVKQSRVLGLNLMMLGAEMRAGRSTLDALNSLADRLDLDEARSFVLVLRQSVELGSDIGEGLRAFSDEMREKRVLRAEEAANKLPVKMVAPLGMFIFPVILMVVMLPLAVRVIAVLPR
jgi:tight adherence protein C